VAKPAPAKVSVDCPQCGFKQWEYVAAKSTMCRQCGRSYAPSALKPESKPKPFTKAEPVATDNASLFGKLEGLWTRKSNSIVECFECKAKQEVSGTARSTICPACSAHIDLQDYKITTSFSRTIRTQGEVHLTAKGDLSSSSVVCRAALIEGKMRGNLQCSDSATININGKIPGRLTARRVVIERKADVQFFRRVHVGSIEIRGRMTGEIIAESEVAIKKGGSLTGDVTARSISVEKGGMFSGQLIIGQGALTQGELLAIGAPAALSAEADAPAMVSQPLPAPS
jgi:cytoskeletal protein CcmA (bactofilin family)/ribosomal protein S27E